MIEDEDLIILKEYIDNKKLSELFYKYSSEPIYNKFSMLLCIRQLLNKEFPKEVIKEEKNFRCGSCRNKLIPKERERPYCSYCGQRIKVTWE